MGLSQISAALALKVADSVEIVHRQCGCSCVLEQLRVTLLRPGSHPTGVGTVESWKY